MLPIPSNPEEVVSIVGIDPGSETLGVAILSFHLYTFEIVRIEAMTFYGSKLPGSPWIGEIFSDRIQRIKAHEENLLNIFNSVNPIAIIAESPFMLMRRPNAYGALVEVICAIRNAVIRYDIWKPLYTVEPSSAKQAAGAKGNADKDQVKAALKKIPEIIRALVVSIETLDEHSVDAIAIAYSQYLQYRDSTLPYI